MPITYRDDATFSPTKRGLTAETAETAELRYSRKGGEGRTATMPLCLAAFCLCGLCDLCGESASSSGQFDLCGGDDEVINASGRGRQLVRLDAPAVVLEDALARRRAGE